MNKEQLISENQWMRETLFGRWFLSTKTWYRYVLTEAIKDFKYLLGDHVPRASRVLDIGCGQGFSFTLLEQYFQPKLIIGADIDNTLLTSAESAANLCQCNIHLQHETVNQLSFTDESFDMIFLSPANSPCIQSNDSLTRIVSGIGCRWRNAYYRILPAFYQLVASTPPFSTPDEISENCRRVY